MPVVKANPETLTWTNFFVMPGQITDPNDGSLVDSVASFNWSLQNLPPNEASGIFTVPDTIEIRIVPDCQVSQTVSQTAALLSHEQLHYDVGIMCARAFGRQIAALACPSKEDLVSKIRAAATLHFTTRAGILQTRYDIETNHGTVPKYQEMWKSRMAAALAAPRADTIGGWYF